MATRKPATHLQSTIRDLARAVVSRSGPFPDMGFVISPDNQKASYYLPLDDVLARGAAFAVRVRPDILALDADGGEQVDGVRRVAAVLKENGFTPVIVESGGPGRLHLFARVPAGRFRCDIERLAREARIDVRCGSKAIRPPLSPHRHGRPVSLVEPRTVREAVRALTPTAQSKTPYPLDVERSDRLSVRSDELSPTSCRCMQLGADTPAEFENDGLTDADSSRPLSPRMQELLMKGDCEGWYLSRSEVEMALALDFCNCGLSFDEFVDALRDPRNAAGDRLREREKRLGVDRASDHLLRTWQRAMGFAGDSPLPVKGEREEVQFRVESLWEKAWRRQWPGKTGATDFATLWVHLTVAAVCGKWEYFMAARFAADRAGMEAKTVRAAQRRLVAGGWLRRVGERREGMASEWAVAAGPVLPVATAEDMQSGSGSQGMAPLRNPLAATANGAPSPFRPGSGLNPAHDAYRQGALGKVGWFLVVQLLREAGTEQDLFRRTGLHRATIHAGLTRLSRVGFVRRSQDGVWSSGAEPTTRRLNRIARVFGSAGRGAKQALRHRKESKLSQQACEARRRANTP